MNIGAGCLRKIQRLSGRYQGQHQYSELADQGQLKGFDPIVDKAIGNR